MARKKKVEEVVQNDTVKQEQKPERKAGHVFYSVHSKSRGGFITEHMSAEQACETVDSYWFEHRRNVAYGKWKPRTFDMYIIKRDTGIAHTHSELYHYTPGSLSEARREAKLRERYGDDYREDEDVDNFDSSKYM
jgi:hypothetical protein